MKKLLLLFLLAPLWIQAQVNGTIQKTVATGDIRYYNSGSAGITSIAPVSAIGTNGQILIYNSTLKLYVPTDPSAITPAISFGAFGSTPNANGGSYSAGVITLQPASASFPGGVTIGAQTFSGAKTFTDLLTAGAFVAQSVSVTGVNGIVGGFTNNSAGFAPVVIINNGAGNLTSFGNSGGTVVTISNNGNITAPAFIGALTGTASNATTWNSQPYTATNPSSIINLMGYDSSTSSWRPALAAAVQAFLGLGSNAYTSTASVTTMAAIGAVPNANGASISGSTLTLQPASTSFGGVVTTSTQAFTGTKTFDVINTTGLNTFGTAISSGASLYLNSSGNETWISFLTSNIVKANIGWDNVNTRLFYGGNSYFQGTGTFTGALTGTSATLSGALNLGGSLANSGSDLTTGINLKQAGNTSANGIYLERTGERTGYFMYIGGGLDALTFQRNYAGTKADVLALNRDGTITASGAITGTSLNLSAGLVGFTSILLRNGSNTAGSGSYMGLADAANTRQWLVQLGASPDYDLKFFHYTAGGSYILPFNVTTAGNGTFLGTSTATGFFESSDIRYKDIISRTPSASGFDMIEFKWKPFLNRDKAVHFGYVAQEVKQVMEDQVATDEKGFHSVNYTDVLVKKVSDLEQRILTLEKK